MVRSDLKYILDVVCEVFLVNTTDIISQNRKREISDARKSFFGIAVEMYRNKYTLQEIGLFIRRDHSTVLHNQKVVRDLCQVDRPFREKYQKALAMVKRQESLTQPFEVLKFDFLSVAQL